MNTLVKKKRPILTNRGGAGDIVRSCIAFCIYTINTTLFCCLSPKASFLIFPPKKDEQLRV
nr:MAG TPA: hypothetical protein [Caudoviricetes sp.]